MSKFNLIRNKQNKKAQIGETTTWIVATIVIIGILFIFIYISLALSQIKKINLNQLIPQEEGEKTDLLPQKTAFAHQLAGNKNKQEIDNALAKPPAEQKNIIQTLLGK